MRPFIWEPKDSAAYLWDYAAITAKLNFAMANEDMAGLFKQLRTWCKDDLFFLLYFVLGIEGVNHPWVVDRVTEVEEVNDKTIDLWAREHFKSTIITYGVNVQTIIRNPEERIGIFSHTRSLAKAHLRRIKHGLEGNELLKAIYPDIFWADPKSEAPKWSEDDGLIVKRKGTFLEATFEAWGLVDGMPTGKHFTILNYDDVVTRESVTTPEQLTKVKECFGLSTNLGARPGKKRVVGTRYHFNDLYEDLKARGNWLVRERPCEDPKTKEPALLTREELDEKFLDQGPYVYSAQMLLNPVADELQEFKTDWLRYYERLPDPINLYITVDPANSKKAWSDYTVIAVQGVDRFGNYFLVDAIRRRLSLPERWNALKDMVFKYPGVLRVGYEEYGLQADRAYITEKMSAEGIHFRMVPLKGRLNKLERIRTMVPLFSGGKYFLPRYPIYQGEEDLVKIFITEEYVVFPYSRHDDFLDAMSRIRDEAMGVQRPVYCPEGSRAKKKQRKKNGASAWAA